MSIVLRHSWYIQKYHTAYIILYYMIKYQTNIGNIQARLEYPNMLLTHSEMLFTPNCPSLETPLLQET